MVLPVIYFVGSFFLCVILYEYYRNNIRKQVTRSDFLENLKNEKFSAPPRTTKRPLNDIKQELRKSFYFNNIRVIFGIDFSASNEWQGRRTFNGQLLHKTNGSKVYNPYQKAISQLGAALEDTFPSNIEYACFGFGDETAKDFSFFPIVASGEQYSSYKNILEAYLNTTKTVALGGPTKYTPIIQNLISIGVRCKRDFTTLIILTDEFKISHTDNALVESFYMLANLPNVCVLVVGIGDGPWFKMPFEERRLREIIFKKDKKILNGIKPSKVLYDNFHFIELNSFISKSDKTPYEENLVRAILTKLPTQLKQGFKNDDNIAHF